MVAGRRHGSAAARRGKARRAHFRLGFEALESRRLLATFQVTNTGDNLGVNPAPNAGTGTLRQAIVDANADPSPGTDNIVFAIPASTAPDLNVPVPGFDPSTQDWTISLAGALPVITRAVSIDGYSEANVGVPYRYPADISSAVQFLDIVGPATGGTFTLTTSAPLPGGTTSAIPYNATAGAVQGALEAIIGAGNVAVSGGPLNSAGVTITFQGSYQGVAIPDLIATNNLTGAPGVNPAIDIQTNAAGGIPGTPTYIKNVPNSSPATSGNNAQVRVVIDGSHTVGQTGFVLDASYCILRGLAIDGFNVGVAIPSPDDIGDLVQGNFIGWYTVFPVDPSSGTPLAAPNNVIIAGAGNVQEGVLLGGANATVGGTDPQDNNVIGGNGAQGVLIEPGGSGNQVLGNQIGVIGPTLNGYYYHTGNGGDGVLIESSGTPGNPASIVYSSSNIVGGAVSGAGNVISTNAGYGVHIEGIGSTRNLVEANFIGLAPGGGYTFGNGDPGNLLDGVRIEEAPNNQIGGTASSDGNVISANFGAGVYITGADASGNSLLNNIIGLTSGGSAVLGNYQQGVAVFSPGTVVGPGNVISANLLGVLVSGAGAAGVIVQGNRIGTDATGLADLGNAQEGVRIDGASGVIIEGDGQGSQVISGNGYGISIDGPAAAGNLITGNFIGTDVAGLHDRGNSYDGVLIEGAPGNTIGGTTGAARNVISSNHSGIRIEGATATANLVAGNLIGADFTAEVPLGNEVNGVIIDAGASNNSIGGTSAAQGNTIAYNVGAGVNVESGNDNSILSNSIYLNGQQGIVLGAGANHSQSAPVVSGASGGGSTANIQGALSSLASTTFLVQFFSSPVADPSGFGQGQIFLGSMSVTTDSGGHAALSFDLSSQIPLGYFVTATATNMSTGDSSAFSNAEQAQAVTVQFTLSSYSVNATAGIATIGVERTGDLSVAVEVNYTTSNGTAVAGQDYTSAAGTLSFPPTLAATQTLSFNVTILPNSNNPNPDSSVNLSLSGPAGGATLGAISNATLIIVNNTNPSFATFVVTNTADNGNNASPVPGSLRAAIVAADSDNSPGRDDIVFAIPASTAPNLNVPVAGFDPLTQTWTIALASPLPPIVHAVSIDGYSQANFPVPYRYPTQVSSAIQSLSVTGIPSGGTFTLTTTVSLPPSANPTTPPLPYNATAAQVQAALEGIFGTGNVVVTGGAVNFPAVTIKFQGAYQGQAIPDLIGTSSLIGGVNPGVSVATTTLGGVPLSNPLLISTRPNGAAALQGNNAQVRVVIDGAATSGATGVVLAASNSILRGLAIQGFSVGVSVPSPSDAGDLIQGNFIGVYMVYPVDPQTGAPLPAPDTVALAGQGNIQQGVTLGGANATLGGTEPQDSNVICGNLGPGVLIEPGASGNQVLNNQIGVIGPSTNGRYFQVGNGAEGVRIASTGSASDPTHIVYDSSNIIGGAAPGAGNIISANLGYGVHIVGVGATRNLVEANFIGAAPGGGYPFGNGNPGNQLDGVRIDDAPYNQVGGGSANLGNVISSNLGAGVYITGGDATGNTVASNIIGLTSSGSAVLGNNQAGVANFSAGTIIGPGNVISANLLGILISGAQATGVIVRDNLIGTDPTGSADLGNAEQGVLIESATDNIVQGDASGPQVISGNQIGVEIHGAASTGNLIEGNFIGTDKTGALDRGNSVEGVLIAGGSANTVGGSTAAAANVISANEWGVRLDGSTATGNVVAGNAIGTDRTGTLPLGNEVNGVIISSNASNNMIGGTSASAGNTIAFNVAAGVAVLSGIGDSILSNSIFSNGRLGIDLVAAGDPPSGVTPNAPGVRSGPNNLQNYPIVTAAVGGPHGSVDATLNSLPSTSFVIQFFSSPVPDPSGYGQGKTFLGSESAMTDSSGNASVQFTLVSGIPAGAWITATATNQGSGDTSEFSNALSAQPVAVAFSMAAYSVNATAGFATIDVQRTGNSSAMASVQYATANGTAIAGKNYLAASGTLTFLTGQTDQTFTITLLPSGNQSVPTATVNLALANPSGGAILGPISTAVLTIKNNLPPTVEFSSATYAVSASAGQALITVDRFGSTSSTVSVSYNTGGGTAVPGRDYTPVSGTLTFLPNQTTATFAVPVMGANSVLPDQTVGLALSGLIGGGSLGPISTATLTILEPLTVVSQQIVLGAGGISAIVYGFSKPLNASRAQNLGYFGYYALAAGPGGVFNSGQESFIPLQSAVYNPANFTVTITPSAPLSPNSVYRIVIDGQGSALLNAGISDTAGNLLLGSDGTPGSPFVSTFAVGSRLSYTDAARNLVKLQLSRGGVMAMFQSPTGAVQQLTLIGTVPGKSTLTGSVRRLHGPNRTYLPPIRGTAGVRMRLKTPPFFFRPTS
jgi:hypothetical protein